MSLIGRFGNYLKTTYIISPSSNLRSQLGLIITYDNSVLFSEQLSIVREKLL